MGTSREYVVVLTQFHDRVNTSLAKHPDGRLRWCAYRRLWVYYSHSKPGFRAERPVPARFHSTVDCTGGIGRGAT